MRNRLKYPQAMLVAGILSCGLLGLSGTRLPLDLPLGLPAAMAAESVVGESSGQFDDQRTVVTRPRLREGSRIGSTIGRFTRVGRRWVFEVESGASKADNADALAPNEASQESTASQVPTFATKYQVLENLALQRIVDAVSQDPNDLRWIATGVITEFSGENWLLLSTVFRAPSKTDSDASK